MPPVGPNTPHSTSRRFVGGLLAVGGNEDLLYVGDEHRVQEFEADGVRRLKSRSVTPETGQRRSPLDRNGRSVSRLQRLPGSELLRVRSTGKEIANFQREPQASGGSRHRKHRVRRFRPLAVPENRTTPSNPLKFGSLYAAAPTT